MIVNKGFSFSNFVGKYIITGDISHSNSSLEDNKIIKPVYPGNLKKLYSQNSYDEGSIAYEFAAIDINDSDEIISFCNKYGLLSCNHIKANITNDYIFFKANKTSFSEAVPTPNDEYINLHNFRREVYIMNCLLGLKSSLDAADYAKMLINIVPVLIAYTNKTCVPFDTETENFNYYFYKFVKEHNDKDRYYKNEQYFRIHDAVTDFLISLDEYINLSLIFGSHYRSDNVYENMFHSTWQAYYTLLFKLLSVVKINVSADGEKIEYSEPITSDFIEKSGIPLETIRICANVCISDIMNSQTRFITPILTVEDGKLISDWQISSLLEAMYMELMVTFSPNSQIKKCANPTCNFYFDVGIGNSRKIYCSERCALLMAKRKQRARDKAKKKASTVQEFS